MNKVHAPRLNIGIILAILPIVLGVNALSGFMLSHTFSPNDNFSPLCVLWSLITFAISALSFTLVLTIIAQAVSSIGNFSTGFWPSLTGLLQESAVWLIIYFLLIWGLPFLLGVFISLYSLKFYSQFFAISIGTVASIVGIIFLSKILPWDIWRISSEFEPVNVLGFRKGVLFIFVLFSTGFLYIHSCYIFEAHLSNRELNTSDQIEVSVKISGRITNHNSMRVKLVAITSTGWESDDFAFIHESEGNYVQWIDLEHVVPGRYHVQIFFHDYIDKSFIEKHIAWMGHNNLTRTLIVRIK